MTSPDHLIGSPIVEALKKNKFAVRMSSDTYQSLQKFLQVKQESLLLSLVNQHFSISVFDGAPRSEVDIQSRSGPLLGEPVSAANKAKVLYGIAKDPEVAAQLAEMEEEREEGQEEDKPKKKKTKKDLSGKKSKSGATPHAPPLTRIPLPKLRDCELLAKYKAYKESLKCATLSATNPPSICFYSVLNTRECLNNVVISEDSSLLVALFSDSSVRVWSLTPQKLLSMLPTRQLNLVPLIAEDVNTRMMDPLSACDVHVLRGHSGPVFSAALNPDNSLLITSSEDGTIRLWSLQLFTTLMVFKAHNHCVWSVDFGPNGYYFASGSQDRTACVWTTENPHPMRVLAGHTSDVDVVKFHPNGNYLATGSCDKTVRLWDILNGDCVRIFSGPKDALTCLAFSPDGKYIASSGADMRILVWCIPTAKQSAEFKGHSNTVYSLTFSRDGNVLASGGLDQEVMLWDCSPLDEENPLSASSLEKFKTKETDIVCLHFTRRNLLLGAGPSK
jgi:transcription initiation factor TFIID subunit 5